MIHVFGTDAHGVNVRPPIVSGGLRYIEKNMGKAKWRSFSTEIQSVS